MSDLEALAELHIDGNITLLISGQDPGHVAFRGVLDEDDGFRGGIEIGRVVDAQIPGNLFAETHARRRIRDAPDEKRVDAEPVQPEESLSATADCLTQALGQQRGYAQSRELLLLVADERAANRSAAAVLLLCEADKRSL